MLEQLICIRAFTLVVVGEFARAAHSHDHSAGVLPFLPLRATRGRVNAMDPRAAQKAAKKRAAKAAQRQVEEEEGEEEHACIVVQPPSSAGGQQAVAVSVSRHVLEQATDGGEMTQAAAIMGGEVTSLDDLAGRQGRNHATIPTALVQAAKQVRLGFGAGALRVWGRELVSRRGHVRVQEICFH